MKAKKKRRIREPQRRLSDDEIDALTDKHWQAVRERQALEDPIYARPPSDLGERFVLSRLRGTTIDNFNRVLDEAVDDLIRTGTPLGSAVSQLILDDREGARDPKRRERERKRARDRFLVLAIENHRRLVTAVLRGAGHKDRVARKRAGEHAAAHWHKIEREHDDGHARFHDRKALLRWVQRQHFEATRTTPKMSREREGSQPSDEG